MADKVGPFVACWKSLHGDMKKNYLINFKSKLQEKTTRQDAPRVLEARTNAAQADAQVSQQVYHGVNLYSYYSYLYYYPTMHWFLDKGPDSNDYWVGIFDRTKGNDQYITYQWLGYAAQGSYYCGQLNTTKGVKSVDSSDEYELRIFKGSQRLDAETNILRGKIIHAPSDLFSGERMSEIQDEQIDSETHKFLRGIETAVTNQPFEASSIGDLQQQWNNFTPQQQQLLFPILKQDSLPDEIKQPAPKALDLAEPKHRFPDLGDTPASIALAPAAIPSKIVLTITLDYAYTYIYPVVNVTEVVPKKWAWMGMYHTKSDVCFNPDLKIDDDWQWVGNGQSGVTYLNYIEEYKQGPTNAQYIGAIFDWNYNSKQYEQIGLAKITIEAVISATPKKPPPSFSPDFDKEEALRYARLSQLAYEPYVTVKKELKSYGLKAEMQIYDQRSDTNGFIASDESSVVVAFRGTNSWTNILTDIWFRQVPIERNGRSRAHEGFITALNAVYSDIQAMLKPVIGQKKLFITGHSLGGALATVLGYRISLAYPHSQPIQYVYGCPPVGDISLSNYFRGMNSNTITIENDPISSGQLILLGAWVNQYKPYKVYYLPRTGGHGIAEYIKQLQNLRK